MVALPHDLALSGDSAARLNGLVAALNRWNPAVNLVSRNSLPDAWSRHVLDSLQLLDLAPSGARHWADLGSGGGFPGLVVAIAAMDRRPDLRVTLVEADQRKAAFLRETARDLGVPVQVAAERIEHLPPLAADVVSARALAPMITLWDYARRHLAPGGTGLFLKGQGHAAELEEARRRFDLEVETVPSATAPGAVVLKVRAHG